MDHAAEDAGGVFDWFAAAELDVVLGEEHDVTAELADPDLEGDAGSGGGFREDDGPGLAGEREVGVCATSRLHLGSEVKERL